MDFRAARLHQCSLYVSFTGYEDKISATSTQDAPSENRPTTDVRSKIDTPGNVDSGRSTPMSSSEPSSQGKKPKKKKKKNRKGSKAV